MLRRFSIFILLLAIVLTVWFVIKSDGVIVIDWLDYHIETSFIFSILILFFLLMVVSLLMNFLSMLKKIPSEISDRFAEIKNKKNLGFLTDSLKYIILEDQEKAKKYTSSLLANFDDVNSQLYPVITILAAKSAGLSDNVLEAEKLYRKILDEKKMELIALKGLIKLKIKHEKYREALQFAEDANYKYNNLPWLYNDLIIIYKKLRMWEKAEKKINKAETKGFITKEEANQFLVEVVLNHIKELNVTGDFEQVIIEYEKLAKQELLSLEDSKNLIKLYIKSSKTKSAIKLIEDCWVKYLDYDIAKFYEELYAGDDKKIIKKLNELKDLKPDNYQSWLIILEFLLKRDLLDQASEYVKEIEKFNINEEIAKIMLIYECKTNNNHDQIIKWVNYLAL